MWIYFRCFLYYLLSSLFATKSADTKSIYIGNAESFSTRDTYTSNTYARGTYVRNNFSALDACIKSADPDGIGIEDDNRKSTCTESVCTVKHSKIHLQSFSILEMELFGTSWWLSIDILLLKYGFPNALLKLGNGVRVGW